ncbi:MAG: sigma-54 dependent transcriptional regulator [Pseudomonadota bacterium]
MKKGKILIVDDERDVRMLLGKVLLGADYQVDSVSTGSEALELVKNELPDVVILDLMLPDMDGLKVLKKLKEIEHSIQVIILTGHESVKSAVEAMKLGAHHYMPKPFDNDELVIMVDKAIEAVRLEHEVCDLRREVSSKFSYNKIIGESSKKQKNIKLAMAVADSDVTVLITGDSGTGKGLLAKTIHNNSKRNHQRFNAIDCASLPDSLIESELFGYEKGAFTGAVRSKAGKFELTDGGTIFLDEICNISMNTQAKLLRVLEERCVERLGGERPIDVDVRIIAATNANIEAMMKSGQFRRDLYHRLNEFPIHIPPLKEQREDISLFVDHFIKEFNDGLNIKTKGISMGARALLESYDWPGNIRELKNIIKRAMLLSEDGMIVVNCLPEEIKGGNKREKKVGGEMISLESFVDMPLRAVARIALRQVETALIKKALKAVAGKKSEAAKRLGIDEKTLYNKRKEYKL